MSLLRLSLPGGLGLGIRDASPSEVRAVEKQLGLTAHLIEGESARGDLDLIVRFVERMESDGKLCFIGRDEAAFDESSYYVLRGRFKSRVRVRVPFDSLGSGLAGEDPPTIVCEHGLSAVPLLVPILNLLALGRGVLPLHASAFVHEGAGCLCTGWSKGGKTEALLAFTDRGARYIGDEWVYLVPAKNGAPATRLAGLPEPVRVWQWHLEEVPRFKRALPLRERARLQTLGLAYAGLRRATAGGARQRGGLRTLNRIAPLLQRQLGVNVPVRDLFGGGDSLPECSFDRLFFVVSSEEPDIVVRAIDPLLVAHRMVASLQTEMAPLRARYEEFRFAFPDRRCELMERSADIQAELLERLFANKPAFEVSHPYPLRLPELFGAMAPHAEAT